MQSDAFLQLPVPKPVLQSPDVLADPEPQPLSALDFPVATRRLLNLRWGGSAGRFRCV